MNFGYDETDMGVSDARLILIIGCGRSGTHWIGYTLKAHRDISVTIEQKPIFTWVTTMALDPMSRATLFPKLICAYQQKLAKAAPRLYADKSHPNLWLAEDLLRAFPNALFVGIQRDPFATVASMLQHKGVSRWCQEWTKFPTPNRFLGISPLWVDRYGDMSLAARCALRWRAHAERMDYLQSAIGSQIYVVSYEQLIQNTAREVESLNTFLDLASPLPVPKAKSDSLDRWKTELSASVCDEIREIINHPEPVFSDYGCELSVPLR